MTDTEKLTALREFIRANLCAIKPHECQGICIAEEYALNVAARKLLRETKPERKEKTK